MTAIVDLDGTLVDCNSFTEFVKYLFRHCRTQRFSIAGIVIMRKLRIISHHAAKEKIVGIADKALGMNGIEDFISILKKHVRPEIIAELKDADRVILATAAPWIYVAPLSRRLGIKEFCATLRGYPENCGERKMKMVERMGVEFSHDTIVITDHYDDLPLLRRNSLGRNIVIKPSSSTLMHIRLSGIKANFIIPD